jgi:hypothetical protein
LVCLALAGFERWNPATNEMLNVRAKNDSSARRRKCVEAFEGEGECVTVANACGPRMGKAYSRQENDGDSWPIAKGHL